MTYATVPSVDGEWYFVTDGQWIEGGDMSKSTARAIASRLNEQAAEIERLKQWQLKAIVALSACYQAGHREGWQDGPTTSEAMEMVLALVPFPEAQKETDQ